MKLSLAIVGGDVLDRIVTELVLYIISLSEYDEHLAPYDGIYFILEKKTHRIIYVGSSVNIKKRIKEHEYQRRFLYPGWEEQFSIKSKNLRKELFRDLRIEEAFWIALFQPEMNRIIKAEL